LLPYLRYVARNPRRVLDLLGLSAVFVARVGWCMLVLFQPNSINTTKQTKKKNQPIKPMP
jgi:hypothetical protein